MSKKTPKPLAQSIEEHHRAKPKLLQTWVSESFYEMVRQRARQERRSVSNFLRGVISKEIGVDE